MKLQDVLTACLSLFLFVSCISLIYISIKTFNSLPILGNNETIIIHEDSISCYGYRKPRANLVFLKKGRPAVENVHISDGEFLSITFQDRDYRKLLPEEVEQLDAIPKIEIRAGDLFFENNKIKTNVSRVLNVWSAHYWNEGVIIAARISDEPFPSERYHNSALGFVSLDTNACKFSTPYIDGYSKTIEPAVFDFLVPCRITMTNNDLIFDVKIPRIISKNDKLQKIDCTVSLTNVSNRPILIPDSLLDNLGITPFVCNPSGVNWMEMEKRLHMSVKIPKILPFVNENSSLLSPSETRESMVTVNVPDSFSAHSYRIVFYWDGFLNPADKNEMSRFVSEKFVVVMD